MVKTCQVSGYDQQCSRCHSVVVGCHYDLSLSTVMLPRWCRYAPVVLLLGCETVSQTIPSVSLLTAVSDDRQYVASVVAVTDKYALLLNDVVILPLTAIPTDIQFSPTNTALLIVVNGDLYRYDIPARSAKRLYEGVSSAEFSPSGQDIYYTTDADF